MMLQILVGAGGVHELVAEFTGSEVADVDFEEAFEGFEAARLGFGVVLVVEVELEREEVEEFGFAPPRRC